MTTVQQIAASDATTIVNLPDRNYAGGTKLSVASGSLGRVSYLYFNRPFPIGATILSAHLNLYQKGAATGGSRQLIVNRVGSSWQESRITFNNAPALAGSASTVTQGNSSTDGRLWRIDVTAQMQSVADGAAWYGLRVLGSIPTIMYLYAREAGIFQPTLDLVYADSPAAPADLAPSNGRAVSIARPTLRFDFADVSGDTTMQAFELEMNATDSWSSPSFSTGAVTTSDPEWEMTFDVTVGATWFWRVRVQDGAGLWSEWADAVSFTRTARPSVTITNPGATPNDVVFQANPIWSWTFSGGTQKAYQIFLNPSDDLTEVLWTSGKVSTAATSHAMPNRSLMSPGGEYAIGVHTWDAVNREGTPGDPVTTRTVRRFTFGLSNTVAPVVGLTATATAPRPEAVLEWTRSTAPDSYTIIRNGVTYETGLDPADLLVSGTTYQFKDFQAVPRHETTYTVLAVTGGYSSDVNPTASVTPEPEGVWLSKLDGSASVCLTGTGPIEVESSEDSAVHKPLGASNPVLITQKVHGREGDIEGYLEPADSDAFAALRTPPGQHLALTGTDQSMRVFIHQAWRGDAEEFTQGRIPVGFQFCELI